jgi:N,N-dimethylformamidase
MSGRLVNIPYRGMRGSRWSGTEMQWCNAPCEYAAIHFHEDDLHDCGWDADFALTVPENTPSGVYGVRLRKDGAQDILPFYVLPARDGARNKICFLASTFTHQAYANHARGNCDDAMRARMAEWGASLYNPDDYPIYGHSTYNFHPDGTGVSISSRLRPTLTIRPGYLTFTDAAGSGLRHFSADTHLLYWLEQRGIDFDIITDEDLDDEGPDLLDGYETVLTGSHPEYHTAGMLDSLQGFTETGGKLIYLGGNGFYWKICRVPTLPGVIELRRAEGGIRAWSPLAGESHHQLDGGYGGLWRRNGRPPQQLVGVGFSAQGLFESSYYRRTKDSFHPDVDWIFDGVREEKLGDYGLSGGGAAGFELDRADPELGTPPGTIILAVSENHSDSFIAVPEELLSHIHTETGEDPADLIRAEIVYCPKPNGGALFSVGSICFCGSLNHNGGDNGVSRMLENVIRRFAGV